MVGETVVLSRVQHLEQGAGRISLKRDSELVDLIEEKNGVSRPGLLHAVENPAGKCPDVGPAMAPDVGLVARPTE